MIIYARVVTMLNNGVNVKIRSNTARSEKDRHSIFVEKFRPATMMLLSKKELEDRFYELLQENVELKKMINQQNEKIRVQSTKLQRAMTLRAEKEKDGDNGVASRRKVAIEDQKDVITELRTVNGRLKERIKRLNMQLCTARQFLRKSSQMGRIPKNLSSNALISQDVVSVSSKNGIANRSTADAKAKNNNESNAEPSPPAVSLCDSDISGIPSNFCEENKCKELLDDLKQRISTLQEELEKTNDDYRDRISELELEVLRLNQEKQQLAVENAARQHQIQLKELEVAQMQKERSALETKCDDLTMKLALEKGKVDELLMQIKSVNLSAHVAKTIEEYLNKQIKAVPIKEDTIQKQEELKTNDDSGYIEPSPEPENDERDMIIKKKSEELLNKIANLNSEIDLWVVKTGNEQVVEDNIEITNPLGQCKVTTTCNKDKNFKLKKNDTRKEAKEFFDERFLCNEINNCATQIDSDIISPKNIFYSEEEKIIINSSGLSSIANTLSNKKRQVHQDNTKSDQDNANNPRSSHGEYLQYSSKKALPHPLNLSSCSNPLYCEKTIYGDVDTTNKMGDTAFKDSLTGFDLKGYRTRINTQQSNREVVGSNGEKNLSGNKVNTSRKPKYKSKNTVKAIKAQNFHQNNIDLNIIEGDVIKPPIPKPRKSVKHNDTIKEKCDKIEVRKELLQSQDEVFLINNQIKNYERKQFESDVTYNICMQQSTPLRPMKVDKDNNSNRKTLHIMECSPDDTDNEISTLSDLPSEKEPERPSTLSPGEEIISRSTFSDSKMSTIESSLSEGELPVRRQSSPLFGKSSNSTVKKRETDGSSHSVQFDSTVEAVKEELARCRELLHVHRKEIQTPVSTWTSVSY